ncbi:protein KRBA1-like [Ctenodactylus gundi]
MQKRGHEGGSSLGKKRAQRGPASLALPAVQVLEEEELEKRSGPAPGDRPRGLEAECRRPSIAAKTQARLLPQDPLEPLSKSPIPAAVSPAQPATTPLPPCACGRSLQQELHNLGATLAEKLDQLAVALAGLAQEVATMRTQVDQLGRSPQRPGSKGQTSWPWSCPRRPRWVISPGHRHPPYWRQKGPTRPRPKILRAQVEGCRAGDPPGLSRRRVPPVPQLPADASLTEPSRPNHSSCQQPPSAPVCSTVPTEHSLLGHTGRHQSPLSHSLPAALPPQRVSPDTDLSAAGAAPVSAPALPKDPSSLLGAAFREDLWGSEHRDPRWGTH